MPTTRGETFTQTNTGQIEPVASHVKTASTIQTVPTIAQKKLYAGALPVGLGKRASHYQWTDNRGVTHTAYVVYKKGEPAYVVDRGKQIPIAHIKAMGGIPVKFKKAAPVRRETLGEKTEEYLENIGRIAPSGKYQVLDFKTGEMVPVSKSTFEERQKAYSDTGIYTPSDLREVLSGEYTVFDYKTNRYVPVTKAQKEQYEQQYKGKVAQVEQPIPESKIDKYQVELDKLKKQPELLQRVSRLTKDDMKSISYFPEWIGGIGTEFIDKIDNMPTTIGMENLPWLDEISRGALRGAVDLGIGSLTLPAVAITGLVQTVSGNVTGAGQTVVETIKGIKDYFVDLAKEVAITPLAGIPRATVVLAPTLIEAVPKGIKAGIKAGKTARVVSEPFGLPKRAMAVELDVSRIHWKEAGYKESLKAVGEALEKQLKTPEVEKGLVQKIIVNVGDKTLELKYRRSPIQTQVPDTIYHATPNVSKMLAELKQKGYITVKGQLYTSPQVAMDFLRRSATGIPPENPAILAIRISDLKGFKTPFKQYKGAIEAEVVGEGIKLYPTETNLYSRAFGKGKTGETFTQYLGQTQSFKLPTGKTTTITSGQLIPTYWLRTAGTKAGTPSIGSLYAATGMALIESIKDLPYLRFKKIKLGFYGSGELSPFRSIRTAYDTIKVVSKELETKAIENVKRVAKKNWTKEDYTKAVRNELDRLTTREVKKILDRPEIKRALRENRSVFNDTYTLNLGKYFSIVSLGSRGELENRPSITETPPSIITTYSYRGNRLTKIGESRVPIPPSTTYRPLEVPPRIPPSVPPSITTTRTPTSVPPSVPPSIPPRTPPTTPPSVPPSYPPPKIPPDISPPVLVKDMTDKQKSTAFAHPAYRWKQGFGWWAVNEKGQKAFFKKPLPSWNVGRGKTPAETIQTAKGAVPPKETTLDLGIQDIVINKPAYEPGRKGAIKFRADLRQETTGNIALRIRGTKAKLVTGGLHRKKKTPKTRTRRETVSVV